MLNRYQPYVLIYVKMTEDRGWNPLALVKMITNHRRLDCLFNILFSLTSKTKLKLCTTGSFLGESIVDLWSPTTKGQRYESITMIDIIKWKHFPRYWPFVRGIHQSPVSFPHKDQWRGALMFPLICAWTNDYVDNHDADAETPSCFLWRHGNDSVFRLIRCLVLFTPSDCIVFKRSVWQFWSRFRHQR